MSFFLSVLLGPSYLGLSSEAMLVSTAGRIIEGTCHCPLAGAVYPTAHWAPHHLLQPTKATLAKRRISSPSHGSAGVSRVGLGRMLCPSIVLTFLLCPASSSLHKDFLLMGSPCPCVNWLIQLDDR